MSIPKIELFDVLIMQWMVGGLGGVPGLAVTSAVVVDVRFGPAPVPALHPRMVGRNAKERRIRSNPATPSPVVRLTQHLHPKIEHPDPPPPPLRKQKLTQHVSQF